MPTYIEMPKLSDTMTEGTLAKWRKKEGDKVEVGDIIAEVETDKATMEMEAFDDGVLHKILIQDGGKAPVGGHLAILLGEGEDASSIGKEPAAKPSAEKKAAAPADKKASASAAPAATAPDNSRVKASPLAKKIAKERGVSLAGVTGSGPGGRVVAKDVPEKGSAPVSGGGGAPAMAAIPPDPTLKGERVPLTSMRRIIAERLLASKTQIPHFYLHIEVDAAPIMKLRKEVNDAAEKAKEEGVKITLNDFALLATAKAVQAVPKVNAAFAGDAVIEYSSVNLAVAVAIDDGLVTPVIKDAQNLTLKQISAAVKDLAGRARSKKLKPDEFAGGTITVSNLGAYGIERFAAIVNPPQAAIVAIGAIVKKPVVNARDEIVIGSRMSVSLSCDHRVVDGAVGAEYLAALKKFIENPALMLF